MVSILSCFATGCSSRSWPPALYRALWRRGAPEAASALGTDADSAAEASSLGEALDGSKPTHSGLSNGAGRALAPLAEQDWGRWCPEAPWTAPGVW